MSWRPWLRLETILAIHAMQIANMSERSASAIAAYWNRIGLVPSNTQCSAALTMTCRFSAKYAIAIALSHPFVNGNKRVAFVALGAFLALNGLQLSAGDASCVSQMLGLASGDSRDNVFTIWVRTNAHPVSQKPKDASEA